MFIKDRFHDGCMNKHIEKEIKEIVDAIYEQEIYYYCSFCRRTLAKAELENDIFHKDCGSVVIDLREYTG